MNERAVIFPTTDILHGKSADEFKAEISQKLKGRVREAWLFGSLTGENFDRFHSDVDLILIAEIDLPFVERWKHFKDILAISEKMDLLVYTPKEWKDLSAETTGFWGSVNRQRIRLL